MVRRLDPDEAALWRRVAATVRPLAGRVAGATLPHAPKAAVAPTGAPRIVLPPRPLPPAPPRAMPVDRRTLDGGWDRRLVSGRAAPDRVVDLHGLTLAAAHGVVEDEIARAYHDGVRLLLLVTGKPPRPGADGEPRRGLIRAQVMHWLSAHALSHRIAAVRPAHPRHGGAGALYIVLRRDRTGTFP